MRILLEATALKHYIATRLLIDVEKLQVHQGDRIGLVGHNGSGKTTLLQMLCGNLTPEQGLVTPYSQLGYIPQLKAQDMVMSGGEMTQKTIQQVLGQQPELLLADEPTANLDISHIEALEHTMKSWTGAFIIVSHDRDFLDALCTMIWEIEDSKITVYKGNYSDYINQKDLERRQAQLAHKTYEQKKQQLEAAIKLKERKAQQATKKPKNLSSSEARIKGTSVYFANKQKKLRQTMKAMQSRLGRLETIEKVVEHKPLKMSIPSSEILKRRIVMHVEELAGNIKERTLWRPATFNIRSGDKLVIIGANGTGKTTLMKQLVSHQPGITISPAVKIGYFSQNLDILDLDKTILENVRATSKQDETLVRTVLARMHFAKEDVYKRVGVLSGGERVKVALTKVFLSDVNTLLLDEPTNYLDTQAIEAFETLLNEYEGTVIVASHDRRFIDKVATRILAIEDLKLTVFEGNYQAWLAEAQVSEKDEAEDEKLLLDVKIAAVLSRLSVEPSEALEQEFQKLLKQKRALVE
ncbi:Vga family ABC-F type ribosomal protection protein [Staphylococcus americanisciuri]|uniref:ABC-F type ribosomal protection protein n=1 Tax=Staphylococcus americanisciuri TaxID=2973940 RepID=A0ABT2EYQ6_9STAP|nr:ABC-F type ribosomal protection protein [Staphylococcus americanisciuri]MCS4485376.1 ABC-F type ribosomal protection protein [Staphylococcus americanisciuri]